jgi:hypothetical protein
MKGVDFAMFLRGPNKTTSRRVILRSFTLVGERCATRADSVDIRIELAVGIILNETIKRISRARRQEWPRFKVAALFQEVEGWIC